MSNTTRPTIVCLCGSTRFSEAFQRANLTETLAGRIVLTIGCDMHSDDTLLAYATDEQRTEIKARLDDLHLRKIDLADEVLILNVGGYIGASTRGELDYAHMRQKRIRYLEAVSLCPDCHYDLSPVWTDERVTMYRCNGCAQTWDTHELRKAAFLESAGNQP